MKKDKDMGIQMPTDDSLGPPDKAGYSNYSRNFTFYRVNEPVVLEEGTAIPRVGVEPLDELRIGVAKWVSS